MFCASLLTRSFCACSALQREDILGRARGTLRYVGMVTIILNDYPIVKYVLVGIMGLFVLTNKEG